MHFVVFFNKSILANSFGEWILANTYVLPIAIQGEFKNFANENIGPVPAEETLMMEVPNESSAAFFTDLTKGSEIFVLAAASP